MWSIEDLEEGRYGIVLTQGQKSRTVFMAFQAGDAAELLQVLETHALLKGGAPVEIFSQPKPRRGRK